MPPRGTHHVRTFATTTAGLRVAGCGSYALADLPASHPGRHGGNRRVLESCLLSLKDSLDTQLLNARPMHNVPGRKTDLLTEDEKDAAWIAQLVEHGLVGPASCPAADRAR